MISPSNSSLTKRHPLNRPSIPGTMLLPKEKREKRFDRNQKIFIISTELCNAILYADDNLSREHLIHNFSNKNNHKISIRDKSQLYPFSFNSLKINVVLTAYLLYFHKTIIFIIYLTYFFNNIAFTQFFYIISLLDS